MASETEVRRIRRISYQSPQAIDRPKVIVPLERSDILNLHVQVVQPHGGETNMHAHSGVDSCWFVLSGRARFYGAGDELVAEASRHEGVFIPKGVPYWFEAAGEEPLEILHITARDSAVPNERVNYAPPTERQGPPSSSPAVRRLRQSYAPTRPPGADSPTAGWPRLLFHTRSCELGPAWRLARP